MKTIIIKILLFFVSVFHLSVAQNQMIELKGRVINKKTQQAIEDVLIISNNDILGFTDQHGNFNLKFNGDIGDNVTFSHFTYTSLNFKIQNPKEDLVIEMLESSIELDEIVIGENEQNYDSKQFVKAIKKSFATNIRKEPYWADANLKQITLLNDTLPAYLEIDSKIFMLGNDPDVWNFPIMIPIESRRTKENFLKFDKNNNIIEIGQSKPYTHLGLFQIYDLLFLSYRFFEIEHPLNNRKVNFEYSFEGHTYIENKKYYIINYKSKKGSTKIKGFDFHFIRGQMFIHTEDLSLKKVTYLSTRGSLTNSNITNIFTIHYTTINKIVYPQKIHYKLGVNWNEPANKNLIASEGILNFSNIKENSVENYRKTISGNRWLFMFDENYNQYNTAYWTEKLPKEPKLQTVINEIFGEFPGTKFNEGSSQKLLINADYKDVENEILKALEQTGID